MVSWVFCSFTQNSRDFQIFYLAIIKKGFVCLHQIFKFNKNFLAWSDCHAFHRDIRILINITNIGIPKSYFDSDGISMNSFMWESVNTTRIQQGMLSNEFWLNTLIELWEHSIINKLFNYPDFLSFLFMHLLLFPTHIKYSTYSIGSHRILCRQSKNAIVKNPFWKS